MSWKLGERKQTRSEASLLVASKTGCLQTVLALLKTGNCDVNEIHVRNITALYIGARNFTPLMLPASQNGHNSIVMRLLDAGADPNICRDGNISPLYIASQNGHEAVVASLLSYNANPALWRDGCATPVYIAAQNGHYRVIDLLLSCHPHLVDVNSKDGATPLMIAAQLGHLEVVRSLVRYGSNIFLSQYVLFPIEIAISHQQLPIAQYLAARGGLSSIRLSVLALFSASLSSHIKLWLEFAKLKSCICIAADARIPEAIEYLLYHGAKSQHPIDSFDTRLDLSEALSLASTRAFPWSPAVCPATLSLLQRAQGPWKPCTHHLYGPQHRAAVLQVLMCMYYGSLSALPTDCVLHILGFLQRSAWDS